MKPDGRALPLSCERRFPHRENSFGIDPAVERRNRLPGFIMVDVERTAAMKVVGSRRWSAAGVDTLQGDEEFG